MHTGDGWAVAADGSRFWGTLGAAGLFLLSPDQHVLIQHRSKMTAQGGTWALPGGALEVGETPTQGALRETHEETGIPPEHVRVDKEVITAQFAVEKTLGRRIVLDADHSLLHNIPRDRAWLQENPVIHPEHGSRAILGIDGRFWWEYEDIKPGQWTYTTVLGHAESKLAVVETWESSELLWQPLDRLEELNLMPAFAASLAQIRNALE